jgi:pyridoxamine 5'-phosphate oxidase
MESDLQKLRKDYCLRSLDEKEVSADPFVQFKVWFSEALSAQLIEPNAMILATASRQGTPSARAVLLKEYDEQGFVFYTNYKSRKAKELEANPNVALLFYWPELERQIRIEGSAEKVSREQTERYFSNRPRKAQIGALASSQSSALTSRSVLEEEAVRLEKIWDGKAVPCPEYWGGYVVGAEVYDFGRAAKAGTTTGFFIRAAMAHGVYSVSRRSLLPDDFSSIYKLQLLESLNKVFIHWSPWTLKTRWQSERPRMGRRSLLCRRWRIVTD